MSISLQHIHAIHSKGANFDQRLARRWDWLGNLGYEERRSRPFTAMYACRLKVSVRTIQGARRLKHMLSGADSPTALMVPDMLVGDMGSGFLKILFNNLVGTTWELYRTPG